MMKWTHDDFITGERLQALAEVTVLTRSVFEFHASLRQSGVTKVVGFPGGHTQMESNPEAIAHLRGHRSIFVYTHLVRSFVERVLPQLDHSFVLITHNSDHGIGPEFRAALDDSRILHWFAQNTLIEHPKLTALPIGIANAQWPHGNLSALLEVANRPRATRREVVYLNFEVRTNPAVRIPLLQRLERSPLAWRAPPRPFADYLDDMANCRWVVSPPGNGIDCHRTWEALYLGTTPIVARSEHGAALHDGLPIIQLPDLGNLDPAALQTQPADPQVMTQALRRLQMKYWSELIRQKTPSA
jgi:hypothetical protein